MSTTPAHDGRTALTIWQPWAWLIVAGFKDVENRTWWTPYRGDLWIHAGKKFDDEAFAMIKERFPEIPMPAKADFKMGGIVGKARLKSCTTGDHPSKWAMTGVVHWNLTDPVETTFEPMRGAQGLFIVGNQKRVVELPAGFITRGRKNPGGYGYDVTLYRGNDITTAVEESTHHATTRGEAMAKAISRAHHLNALPGLESLTAGQCQCNDHPPDTTANPNP